MDTPLRTLRTRRGMTLADVAAAVGLDDSTLSRIENGGRTTPETAEKLAKHFGHEVTELQILYPERYVA